MAMACPGRLAAALMAQAPVLLAAPPVIERVDVRATKDAWQFYPGRRDDPRRGCLRGSRPEPGRSKMSPASWRPASLLAMPPAIERVDVLASKLPR
jgi:hypothetical protein